MVGCLAKVTLGSALGSDSQSYTLDLGMQQIPRPGPSGCHRSGMCCSAGERKPGPPCSPASRRRIHAWPPGGLRAEGWEEAPRLGQLQHP